MAKNAVGPVRRTFAPWNDPAKKPFIVFDHVTKRFGDFVAVDDVSLGIYEREFFALLGPSGCGKTTLMRMVAGFEEPTEGRVSLDGHDLAGVPPYRRPSNMMFQSYALFPHMNVEANIAFGLKQEGMPKDQIAQRVEEMLKMVKLTPCAKRKPHQKLREETQFELTDLQYDLGLTFIIVTHDQEEAMTLADRIAVMDHGKIIQIGTPAEIYEQPNSRYVADFIGNINLLEGRIVSAGGGAVRIDSAGTGAAISVNQDLAASPGDPAWFAIRPEKLSVSLDKPADTSVNALTGEVNDIFYLGDISIYHVRLATGATVKATLTNRTRLVERPITWSDKVWLTWHPDSGIVLTK